jgi:hypothetical protein|eukprot:COSAG01_NODE_7741_length_3076_cov_11.159221_6_plen_56_part_00
MTNLYKFDLPLATKFYTIMNLAATHCRSLGSFALLYKGLQAVSTRALMRAPRLYI